MGAGSAGSESSTEVEPDPVALARENYDVADLLWRPLPGGNSFEWTVQRLAQVIRFGVVAPDERLPSERELAERLRVGRETVREAIRTLRDAGMVRTARGRTGGTFVTSATALRPHRSPHAPEEIRDIVALRGVLECGAVTLAAQRGPDDLARADLERRLAQTLDRDPAVRRVADSRLHLALAAGAGSPSLLAALADVHSRLDELLGALPPLPLNLDSSDQQHRVIVEAVLSGDVETARATMESHCEATALLLESLLG